MKFFFGLLAFLAAIIVVILLVFGLFRRTGQGNPNVVVTTDTVDLKDEALVGNSAAQYRLVGPVIAAENHNELQFTISKSSRTIDIYRGYNGEVIKSETFPNTPESYRAFLGALDAARYSAKRTNAQSDARGICVTGNKAFYSLVTDGTKKVDTWTSSCSLDQGSFGGNAPATSDLFRKQIPTYSTITNGITDYLF